jgi:uncharacterized protein YbjT (DUF2867 family)
VIVICTPTGQVGHQVLGNVLRAGGEPVRVIARDPSRLPAEVRERVEVVKGSMTDAGVVAEALAGAGSVFWLLPPDPSAESVEGHRLAFVRPLREAIASQGVRRVVYISGLGESTAGPLINSTGADSRGLACPAFMENLLQQAALIRSQGMFCYPISGDRKLPVCATRDIAAVAARLLLDGSWTGQESVPVLGPEDLSYNDMASVMSEVLGRPVRYQQVPGEAFQAMLTRNGMAQEWARRLVERLVRVDQGLYNAEPRTPQATTPTSFRQWCEEVLKPALS